MVLIYKILNISIILIILDLLYYHITKNIYINKIEEIQKNTFNFRISGAIIRYILLILGLVYFVLNKNGSLIDAFVLGIVFSGTFNGTMYASFNEWNAIGAILDSLWMSILFVSVIYLSK